MMKYDYLISPLFTKISTQRWQIVALLVSKKPISLAPNNPHKTHPLSHYSNSKRQSTHAEIRCLRNTPKSKIKGGILYVWRRGHTGAYRLAKPCVMCMQTIKKVGVKKVIYTTNNGFEEIKI